MHHLENMRGNIWKHATKLKNVFVDGFIGHLLVKIFIIKPLKKVKFYIV